VNRIFPTKMIKKPTVWLGQSADTSAICRDYSALRVRPFLTSLGCAIRKPNLLKSHFHNDYKTKLAFDGPVMVDSGGFVMTSTESRSWNTKRLAKCIEKMEADVFVSLDLPPGPKDSRSDRLEKIKLSVRNYAALTSKFPNKNIMPVVHGRSEYEILHSIEKLARTGYARGWIGVGGMVPLLLKRFKPRLGKNTSPEQLIALAIVSVRQAFPQSVLHVFGAGGTRTFPVMCALGAMSADSVAWRRAAGFGSIFLPMKSQRIVHVHTDSRPTKKILDDSDLEDLKICACPICGKERDVERVLSLFRESFHYRAVHNAWVVSDQARYWGRRTELIKAIAGGSMGSAWAQAVSRV